MHYLVASLVLLTICASSVSSLTCYFCEYCPNPFQSYGVQQELSLTGYCAKKSRSAVPGAVASRGPAEYGLCERYGSGCRLLNGYYTCCCRTSLCNTGNFPSKSTITVLVGALILLAIKHCI